ncbi:unnamed protein product [Euphydryas editha]|uniref:Uncharacterized protein n=1 Tax=Euphydryas editha TaxID=104508 RepID=A0AAU9TKI1_EUPED|nr:unnamed protein product [Euphydryas editha]
MNSFPKKFSRDENIRRQIGKRQQECSRAGEVAGPASGSSGAVWWATGCVGGGVLALAACWRKRRRAPRRPPPPPRPRPRAVAARLAAPPDTV